MKDSDDDVPGPSRAEIETLLVLYVVGSDGCACDELASRLGLSQTLSHAVANGLGFLVLAGWLEQDETENRFSLTEAGRLKLTSRLAELGVE